MLPETILHEKRHAQEMARRSARRARRSAYGGLPHCRGHRHTGDKFEIRELSPMTPPPSTKPGFFSRVFAWLAGRGRR